MRFGFVLFFLLLRLSLAGEPTPGLLVYIAEGNALLFSKDPLQAVERFQFASDLIDRDSASASVFSFLALFGQVVAHDVLESQEACDFFTNQLLAMIEENRTDEDDSAAYQEKRYTLSAEECRRTCRSMYHLANLAPSLSCKVSSLCYR